MPTIAILEYAFHGVHTNVENLVIELVVGRAHQNQKAHSGFSVLIGRYNMTPFESVCLFAAVVHAGLGFGVDVACPAAAVK